MKSHRGRSYEDRDTKGEHHVTSGREWSHVALSQEMLILQTTVQTLGKNKKDFSKGFRGNMAHLTP